jgi:[protein-PII] uridylyltransferase
MSYASAPANAARTPSRVRCGDTGGVTNAALGRFVEARSERSGRASARQAAIAGLTACRELTALLDTALLGVAEEATGQPPEDWPFALVAVGGYGRREQCRHSDIDLMLLTHRGGENDASKVLYPLWDAGLKLGHSVRTVEHAARAGAENVETLTALLDARLVGGDEALYERFLNSRRKLARRQRGWLRDQLAQRRGDAAAREPWQLQAPDVKTGRGGLRDVQIVHWLDAADAIGRGEEPPALGEPLTAARERLLATRNALHALEDRRNDRFRDDLRLTVAEWLDADAEDWSRDLLLAMREVEATTSARLAERARRWWTRGRPANPASEEPAAATDLERLLLTLRRLARGWQRPLEPLPQTEWLERLIPEWEVLRARRHIAPFHLHPVDIHTLRTVFEAASLPEGEHEDTDASAAAAALPGDELLLAAFLHDIGKGHDGDHSEVGMVITERFAARAGLEAGMAARLVAVTQHHLLLPVVATRRDIADERVLRETAEVAGDLQTLRLLYVISVADARASGPDVWNPWKAQLMRSLYLRVAELLADDAVAVADGAAARVDAAIAALSGRFAEPEVRQHLEAMEPGYLLGTSTEEIAEHLDLIAAAEADPAGHRTAARRDRRGEVDRLTVVTPDRPGILQAIAGTLAAHNASVLGGVAYTRDDGVAIQVWHVGDALGVGLDERRWGRILDAVPAALAGEFAIDEHVADIRARYPEPARPDVPTIVNVDNAGSDGYSIVEVSAADRRGLLYAITHELHEMGIDIHLAKVDTIGAEVVDAFYIRRENGRRVEEPDEIDRLERRLHAAVTNLDGGDDQL